MWNRIQKYEPLVKQNATKLEVFILGGQIIDQKRNKGWGREREDWEGEQREDKDREKRELW